VLERGGRRTFSRQLAADVLLPLQRGPRKIEECGGRGGWEEGGGMIL